jgi:flagellar basal body-associated protein FliL
MSSYYKKINGKNYDRAMLDVADKSIEGKGDGRVSLTDAKAIFKKAKDGGKITDIELRTLNYILEKYKFTEPALKYIEDSLSDNLVLKDRGVANNEKQGIAPKETPKENKPVVQKNEKKSSKLKYLIIFLCLLLLLAVFLLINFLCKKGISLTGNSNNEILPALNTVNNEEAKKDTTATDSSKNAVNNEASKKAADTDSSKNTIQNNKNEYVVKQYDTLVKISQAVYGDYKFWEDIYRANRNKIKSPILIYPGQVLVIPEKNK